MNRKQLYQESLRLTRKSVKQAKRDRRWKVLLERLMEQGLSILKQTPFMPKIINRDYVPSNPSGNNRYETTQDPLG